jgi:hypothetical protein
LVDAIALIGISVYETGGVNSLEATGQVLSPLIHRAYAGSVDGFDDLIIVLI